MRKKMMVRIGIAALLLAALGGLNGIFSPTPATATETLHVWGLSNVGETCAGTCGPTTLCCKIVIVVV